MMCVAFTSFGLKRAFNLKKLSVHIFSIETEDQTKKLKMFPVCSSLAGGRNVTFRRVESVYL